jgi:hypothetical protein
MADWYVSSAAYAAIPVWTANTVYTIGQIIRATAPALNYQYSYRITIGGNSGPTEPVWNNVIGHNNGAVGSVNGVQYTNITASGAYGWQAAAGTIACINYSAPYNRINAGDRVFVSSDHLETQASNAFTFNGTGTPSVGISLISINRAPNNIPPLPADELAGATFAYSASNFIIDAYYAVYFLGFTFIMTPSATGGLMFNNGGSKAHYYKSCAFIIQSTATITIRNNDPAKVTFDNTTVQFGSTNQSISQLSSYSFTFNWINTPNAISQAGSIPSSLFTASNDITGFDVTCRGIDISALNTSIITVATNASQFRALFDSCKIGSTANRYLIASSPNSIQDVVEYVNCFDGTRIWNERHDTRGDVTSDLLTTMVGGAADDVGNFSLKMATSSSCNLYTGPLESFWLEVENAITGVTKTATVEILSSQTLTIADVALQLEYLGISGSSQAVFADTKPSVLASAIAHPTSSVSWNSPPSTPQYQRIQLAFVPQKAGRLRGRILLGRLSTTLWVNPQITVS